MGFREPKTQNPKLKTKVTCACAAHPFIAPAVSPRTAMPRRSMPHFTYNHVFEPGNDPAAPTLLLLHGTGGNETDLLRLGRTLSPGSALLSPRGDVSEGGALRFFARLAEGVFDPAEVTRRTLALGDFVREAVKHYELPADRLLALGFSNGANVAATLMLLRPELLAGAVLLRPMV